MGVLKKYISDRTALGLIEQFLKAGYMEDGKVLDIESGTPQGGVISPLLANTYLNELDWELDLNGLRFVRYADDCVPRKQPNVRKHTRKLCCT